MTTLFYILMAVTAIVSPALLVWTKVLDKSVGLLLVVFFLTCVPTILFIGYCILNGESPLVQLVIWAMIFFLNYEVNLKIKLRRLRTRNTEETAS